MQTRPTLDSTTGRSNQWIVGKTRLYFPSRRIFAATLPPRAQCRPGLQIKWRSRQEPARPFVIICPLFSRSFERSLYPLAFRKCCESGEVSLKFVFVIKRHNEALGARSASGNWSVLLIDLHSAGAANPQELGSGQSRKAAAKKATNVHPMAGGCYYSWNRSSLIDVTVE